MFHIHHHLALGIVAMGNKKLESGNGSLPAEYLDMCGLGVDRERAGTEQRRGVNSEDRKTEERDKEVKRREDKSKRHFILNVL